MCRLCFNNGYLTWRYLSTFHTGNKVEVTLLFLQATLYWSLTWVVCLTLLCQNVKMSKERSTCSIWRCCLNYFDFVVQCGSGSRLQRIVTFAILKTLWRAGMRILVQIFEKVSTAHACRWVVGVEDKAINRPETGREACLDSNGGRTGSRNWSV